MSTRKKDLAVNRRALLKFLPSKLTSKPQTLLEIYTHVQVQGLKPHTKRGLYEDTGSALQKLQTTGEAAYLTKAEGGPGWVKRQAPHHA